MCIRDRYYIYERDSININDVAIMHKWISKENYSILHVTMALKINKVFMNQILSMLLFTVDRSLKHVHR